MGGSPQILSFGVFELDLRTGELRKHGLRIKLTGQPVRILAMLLERPGEMVSREELRQKLWGEDVFLDFEHSLNKAVNKLREALSDSAESPRFVETVPRRGYRFIAPIRAIVPEESAQAGVSGAGVPRPLATPESRAGEGGAMAAPYDRFAAELGSRPRPRGSWYRWVWPLALFGGLLAGGIVLYRLAPPAARSAATMTAVPLTSFPGRERYGALSPDGKQVAFVWTGGEKGDDFDLYVKLIDGGTPLRLTATPADEFSPAWSPDNHFIAFYRELPEGHGLFIVPALGGPERKVAESSASGTGFGLAWSPDGRFLAMVDKQAAQSPNGIFLLSIGGSEKRALTSPPANSLGDSFPEFSPDGKTLAFARIGRQVSDIFVVPVSGGQPRQLTFNDRSFGGLAWAADGRSIVFASRRAGGSSLWRVSLSRGEPERLAAGGENAHFPSISRQGNRLAFTESSLNTTIWRIGAPGSGSSPERTRPARLIFSTRREDSPSYSPDGKKIVFCSDRSGFPEIWISDSEGQNPLQLTHFNGPLAGTPRWSPDGRQIAFDSRTEGQADISVISAEGSSPVRLTIELSEDLMPSWSADGRWIYFASNRSGQVQVWKLPARGGRAVQVTRKGGFEAFESSDGKFLYYSKGDGVWRVPVEGGEELPVPELSQASSRRYWAVAQTGIYFAGQEGDASPTIQFFDFTTRRITRVATTEKPLVGGPPGLAVSPDGRWILYTQLERRDSDLTMIENFR